MSFGAHFVGSLQEYFATLRRLFALGRVVTRHVAAAGIVARIDRPDLVGRLARRLGARLSPVAVDEPERIRQIFQELGGSFLKLGQMLAMQPDLLPPAYIRALLDLLDRVPAEPFAAVERVVIDELGASPSALFDRFDPVPFASASIGQVHRASLDGVELAVKIQRPGAEADFRADLRVMRLVSLGIRHLGRRRWRWIADHLDEMVHWTRQELDYRVEARYGLAFERCFRTNRNQRVPRIVESHCSRRVLSMEYLDASTVASAWREDGPSSSTVGSDRCGLVDHGLVDHGLVDHGLVDRDLFARHVIDNFLEQVFVHGLFHADLHPANLVMLPEGAVGYLDLGIVGELPVFARQRLVTMTLSYARGDLVTMSEALLDLSIVPDAATGAEHRERFLRLGESWYERRSGLPKLRRSFTEVLLDMLALSRVTGVWPDRPVLKYVRSLMAIDALVGRLAPGLDVATYLESACRRLLSRRRRGPRRREMARSARHLARAGLRAADILEQLAEGRLLSIRLCA